MAFNGAGVFQRLYNWVVDKNANVKIRADRMDAEFDGIATGLSTCITKDGQTTITANLPMSGFKHTGVGNASARTEYAALGQIRDGASVYCGTVGGTANAVTLTFSPSFPAYVVGMKVRFILASSPTGAMTINVDGLGAKSALRYVSTDVANGDYAANEMLEAVYDGTAFRITSVGRNALTITGSLSLSNIPDSLITKSKIENLANLKVLGNVSGSAAAPAEVSILDEDNMASDSATSLATQQSIKAYVDTAVVKPKASVYHNTTQSIADETETVLAFNAEDFDTGSWHDNATNNSRITVDFTGYVRVTGQWSFTPGTSGHNQRITVYKNGSATNIKAETTNSTSSSTGQTRTIQVSGLLAVSASDYIQLSAWHNFGSSQNALANTTRLMVEKL